MKPEVAKKRAKLRSADLPVPGRVHPLKFHLANLASVLLGAGLTLALLHGPTQWHRALFAAGNPGGPAVHRTNGAWGRLELTPIALPEPDSYLPGAAEPIPAARWVFENHTPAQLAALFESLPATPELKALLLNRAGWQVLQDGVVLYPSLRALELLDRQSRQRLYPLLGESRHNFSHFHPFRFPGKGFRAWFKRSGLHPEILDLIENLTYTNRYGALCLVDIGLLQHRLTPHEFQEFLRSLYREPAVLASLRIAPGDNLDALAAYWGRGGREEEIRPLLHAVAELPDGGGLSVTHLLPTFARNRLYTYRSDTNKVVSEQDCFWTAVNFFRLTPDPRLAAGMSPHQILQQECDPVRDAPRLGDVLVLRQGGSAVHAAVYVAGDVVFTKNGANFRQPWILMRLPDLLARYSGDQPLSVLNLRPRQPAP